MQTRYDQISPVPPLTTATKWLIITCVGMYFIDLILGLVGVRFGEYDQLNQILGLVPAYVTERLWIWQFVTYIFMHGNHFHLLLNMLILWYFGSEIEIRMGIKNFLIYFFLCGIGAGIFNYGVNVLTADPIKLTSPIIGASGAIYGILAAYGVFFGNRYFLVFFLFPMKAKYFVLLIAAIELLTGLNSRQGDNVAHFAHLGGMFVGAIYLYFRYIRPNSGGGAAGRREAEREKLKKQFTLIVNDSLRGNPENPDGPDGNNDRGPFWN